MKQKIHTMRFTCNGYLSKAKKCLATIEMADTEEKINEKYVIAGWKTSQNTPATKSAYHICDWPHVNPITGSREQ